MKHLTDEQLSARLDGALDGRALDEVDRHLESCARCREALATLTEQDRALGTALTHDPGEAYFATFAARVEDRVRAAGLTGAQKRLREENWLGRLFGWWSAPRRVKWAAAVATVIAGAAIVLITSRDERMPLGGHEIAKRTAQREQFMAEPARPPQSTRTTDERAATGTPERADKAKQAEAPAERSVQTPTPTPAQELQAQGATPSRMREVGGGEREGIVARPPPAGPMSTPVPGGGVRILKRNVPQPAATEVARDQATAPVPAPKAAPGNEAGEPATRQDRLAERESGTPPTPASALAAPEAKLEKTESPRTEPSEEQTARTVAPSLAGGFVATGPGEVPLCGHVMDAQGRAVARAQVTLVASGRTVTAGPHGEFCLAAPAGSYEVTAMAVGFEPARLQVRVGGEHADVQITLRAISVLDGTTSPPSMALAPGAGKPDADAAQRAKTEVRYLFRQRSSEAAKDAFANAAPALRAQVDTALAATRAATAAPTAAAYDRAADLWQQVLAAARTNESRSEARWRVAEARMGAWRLDPTGARSAAARTACSAVIAGRPTAAQRDAAARWIVELRREPPR